ncbi:PadR family transcriptional regulator [Candidatus Bathyarchaeota archaeon]|nr:PadR family transcriptional regulator [Candidatus Bathyarchaeota archaeon]
MGPMQGPHPPPLRGLLHLTILHLIKVKPTHGGDIHQGLKEKFKIEAPRPLIYTLLRRMEAIGFIVSSWEMQESGPARRIYRITEDGLEYLRDSLERLRRDADIIKTLLEE